MKHFWWIEEGVLAASEEPGLRAPLRKDLEFLKARTIKAIVSLTEDGLDKGIIEEYGMEYFHIPVEDFGAPAPDQIDAFLQIVAEMRQRAKPTLVHCHAGLGRTGAMTAAFLVSRGMSASDALREVRSKRPGSVEVDAQEDAVYLFEERHRNT